MSDVNASNIFEKIVAGEVPAHKVFENERVLAFLDINPLSEGHTLVIPKTRYERLEQMPTDLVAEVAQVVQRVARAVLAVVDAEDYNVLQNNGPTSGQVVRHVHFHIIPRRADDGLGYRWNAGELSDADAERLREAIGRTVGT